MSLTITRGWKPQRLILLHVHSRVTIHRRSPVSPVNSAGFSGDETNLTRLINGKYGVGEIYGDVNFFTISSRSHSFEHPSRSEPLTPN